MARSAFRSGFRRRPRHRRVGLASRAPLDLRVNTLKTRVTRLSPRSPISLRRRRGGRRMVCGSRSPRMQKVRRSMRSRHSSRAKSKFRTRARSSRRCSPARKPGEQVLDLCAGGGGKTLALAAAMENKGQLYATDDDKRRLAPIHERLARSGARNVQVRTPKSIGTQIDDLQGRMDLVLIDAPCTGTGSWRRNPDAKWRVRPGALEQRRKDQTEILDRAAPLVKPGGRITYVTCSVLAEENGDQVRDSSRAASRIRGDAPRRGRGRAGRARFSLSPRDVDGGGRAADDAASYRYGWLFRLGASAAIVTIRRRIISRELAWQRPAANRRRS